MKYDGSLEKAPTPLTRLFLDRRSVRKYAKGQATPEQVAHIEECTRAFVQRVGFDAPRLRILGEGAELDAVIRAASTGVIGKINPWLPSTHARHMILCGAVYGDAQNRESVNAAIKQAAMAMQVAILAATEVGLATCWMAGINYERVELSYPMPDHARLIAISTLGLPPARMGLSWDTLAFHVVSKRRRPLDELWMREGWRHA